MKKWAALLLLLMTAMGAWIYSASRQNADMGKKFKGNPICSFGEEELKQYLTPEQYEVMRMNGTERPFQNAYWDNKREGIYVDPISGEPLFSSFHKFDSGTGWPSFWTPLKKDNLVEKEDQRFGITRTEVRAKKSNSHLGHVFQDGPGPTGLRYCINSAALRFIPLEDLEKEGYASYLPLFKQPNPEKAGVSKKIESAFFGAGCFWGVEAAFQKVKGVAKTTAGYMGGNLENPTYEEVCSDQTGYAEVVKIDYDPAQISYSDLLTIFWNLHDPTTVNRQGPDVGTQYRSIIFYSTPEEEKTAKALKEQLDTSGRFKHKMVTEIAPRKTFWKAEDYHQNYYQKHGMEPTCHVPTEYLHAAQ